MTTAIYFHQDYVAAGFGFDTTRKSEFVAAAISAEIGSGELDATITKPIPATADELARIHDPSYVDAVRCGEPLDLAESQGFHWDEGLWTATTASTGGIRDAALRALYAGDISGSLSSGLHHAYYDTGKGFCTFNGLVLAAQSALDAGAGRVVIIDVDAHGGGGTASMILGRPGIEQIDLAVDPFDRYNSRPGCRYEYVTDGFKYLDRLEGLLGTVTNPSSIDLVIHNAGMDAHENDSGAPGVTTDVLARREQMIFDWCESFDLPVCWTLAGGYVSSVNSRHDQDAVVGLHMLTVRAAVSSAHRRSTRT